MQEDLDNMLVMSEDDPQKEELPLASPIDELVEQGQAREEGKQALGICMWVPAPCWRP
jgi:hypothetical protein